MRRSRLEPKHRDSSDGFSASTIPRPETTGERIAHWVSQLGSPPAAGVAASSITVARLTVPGLWQWVAIYVLLALAAPLGFLIWQVRQGHVTDLDVYFRKQRKGSLLVTIAGLGLTWLLMNLGSAPPILRFMVGAGLLTWAAIYLVTLRWKISIHAASISGLGFCLGIWIGRSTRPTRDSGGRLVARQAPPAHTGTGARRYGIGMSCGRSSRALQPRPSHTGIPDSLA